jgi:SOS-response transcriptional repressor LexA
MSTSSHQPRFTDKQGQYLSFIHAYALVNGQPPAEADMERFFGVTSPSVHRMVLELEQRGLIRRLPRQPRSIEVILDPSELPRLLSQPIKTSVVRY